MTKNISNNSILDALVLPNGPIDYKNFSYLESLLNHNNMGSVNNPLTTTSFPSWRGGNYMNTDTGLLGKGFSACSILYTTDIDLNIQAMNFHYKIWIKLFGDDFKDYGNISRDYSDKDGKGITKKYIAFGSQATKDHFLNWLKTYKETFFKDHDIMTTTIPDVNSTRKLDGMFVVDIKNVDGIDAWAWIVSHCYHPVIKINSGWLFSDDTESVFFKMR